MNFQLFFISMRELSVMQLYQSFSRSESIFIPINSPSELSSTPSISKKICFDREDLLNRIADLDRLLLLISNNSKKRLESTRMV